MKKLLRHFFAGGLSVLTLLSPQSSFANLGGGDPPPPVNPCAGTFWNANNPNMIQNGDFIQRRNCPSGQNTITDNLSTTVPCFWTTQFNPTFSSQTPRGGSPDYFNICAPKGGSITDNGIPRNFAGYHKPIEPTDESYAGLYALFTNNSDGSVREYLQQGLDGTSLGLENKTLKFNRHYYGEFYAVGSGSGKYDIVPLGMAFTQGQPQPTNNSKYHLTATPQIVNAGAAIDTINWRRVSGTFQAQGLENVLTIGNFSSDQATLSTAVSSNSSSGLEGQYYYIDRVALYEIPYAGPNQFAPCQGSVTLGSGILLPSSVGTVEYIWKKDGVQIQHSYTSFYLTDYPTQNAIYTLEVYVTQNWNTQNPIRRLVATSSATVTANTGPNVYLTAANDIICFNDCPNNVVFKVNVTDGYSSKTPTGIIKRTSNGLTSNAIILPTGNPDEYMCQVTCYRGGSSLVITGYGENPCGGGSNIINFNFGDGTRTICGEEVLRLQDQTIFQSNVYPNPVKDYFIIESLADNFKLYNSQGIKVKSSSLNKEKTKVNTENLNKGLYYLHIQKGNEIEKQQLVIE